MKVTVLIPSKGRPEKLRRAIASIPDWATVAVHGTCAEDIPIGLMHPHLRLSFGPETVVGSFNRLANESDGHVLPASDDAEFEEGCLEAAVAMMDQYLGEAVIGLTVVNMKCNDTAFVLVGGGFLKKRGHLYHPEFEHFFSDTELGIDAKSQGVFYVCADAQIKNWHPAVTGIADLTHQHRRREKWEHDKQIYDRLMSQR